MTYTRDWNSNTPVDHSKFNTQPSFVRNAKVDVAERLSDLIYGFVAGETEEGMIKKLVFKTQGTTPSTVADGVVMYAEDVSSVAEMHLADENGNVIQLTSGGFVNAAELGGTLPTSILSQVFEVIYPVGTVYVNSTLSTNPGTLIGYGTWVPYGTGRVVVGIDTGDSDFDTVGETGGAKTHELTTDEMPSHSHTLNNALFSQGGSGSFKNVGGGNASTFSITANSTGGGSAHNNVQPYIVAYKWERTA